MRRTRQAENPAPGDLARVGVVRRAIRSIRHHWWARLTAIGVALCLISILPVPWLVARTSNPPGLAWRLDGRLAVNDVVLDPPGVWYGMTAGRPPLVAEVVWSWFESDAAKPRDMRKGSRFNTPALAEPAAIAVGLAQAGVAVTRSMIVEAREPLVMGLPDLVWVSAVNGLPIASRDDWTQSLTTLGVHNQFVTVDGHPHAFDGNSFPYGVVDLVDAPIGLEVSPAGWLSLVPESWYRQLAVGRSHGVLLGLAAYSQATHEDLAKGRVIAATGVLRADGTVAPVGGLASKARAAIRAGVDVMIYPAEQHCELQAEIGPGAMLMLPVASLSDAIEGLRDDSALVGALLPCVG
jgi:hypothetical protein